MKPVDASGWGPPNAMRCCPGSSTSCSTDLGVAVVPVSIAQARLARQAYRDFGKGSGHPAQLNFGDCLSFAFAAEAVDETLLYKGTDFRRTGIRSALPG